MATKKDIKKKGIKSVVMDIDEVLTIRDFTDAFKKLLDFVTKVRDELKQDSSVNVQQLKQDIDLAIQRLEARKAEFEAINDETRKISESDKRTVMRHINQSLADLAIPDVFDDSELRGLIAEVRDSIPPIPEQVLETPEDVRDKLEQLEGEERLDASAIKNLQDELDTLSKGIATLKGAASVPSPQNWAKHEAFTMDGATTSVTLADGVGGGGNALIVRYMGQTLDMTTHYTVDGNTVNFTFTPDTATTISVTYWQ